MDLQTRIQKGMASIGAITIMRERIKMTVNEIDEYIKNIAFKGKILFKYGTYDKKRGHGFGNELCSYLYCDVFDKIGFTKIMLTVLPTFME